MMAYAKAALDDETNKLAGFPFGDKFLLSLKDFVALKGFQTFLRDKIFMFFKDLIRQGSELVYIEIFYSCQTLKHKCCILSNNFILLLSKQI